jgi:hypothetical protein
MFEFLVEGSLGAILGIVLVLYLIPSPSPGDDVTAAASTRKKRRWASLVCACALGVSSVAARAWLGGKFTYPRRQIIDTSGLAIP